jgi:hypothetical protein
VDPGAAQAAQGFVPGVTPFSPAELNYILSTQSKVARAAFMMQTCKGRPIPGLTLSSAVGGAPVSLGAGKPVVVAHVHSGGTLNMTDMGNPTFGGTMASITGAINGAAYDPGAGRILAVGSGGNRTAISTNGGVSWSAGGDLGGTGLSLIWNPIYSRFQALWSGNLAWTTNGAAWTNVATSYSSNVGIGMLPNGTTAVLGSTTPVSFVVSTNGGTSWSASGSTISNANSTSGGLVGLVTGGGLDYIYHWVTLASGVIQVSRTSDLSTWSVVATLSAPSGFATWGAGGRFMQCPNTGLLFLQAQPTGADFACLMCSADQGVTWSNPLFNPVSFTFAGVGTMSVAQGRLWAFDAAGAVYVTDGLGQI